MVAARAKYASSAAASNEPILPTTTIPAMREEDGDEDFVEDGDIRSAILHLSRTLDSYKHYGYDDEEYCDPDGDIEE